MTLNQIILLLNISIGQMNLELISPATFKADLKVLTDRKLIHIIQDEDYVTTDKGKDLVNALKAIIKL